MIHLLLLGAVTHSIVVWSNHFAETLLHAPTGPGERRRQSWRLLVLNGGVVLVVTGVPSRGLGADPGRGLPRRRGRRLARRLAGPPAAPVAALPVPAAGALLRRRRGVLPVGAGLGAVLARGLADPLHDRVTLAHVAVNVLGWMGLTVVGTLVTLWPTMLRTRIADGAERAARRALPVLLGAVVVTAAGALAGLTSLAAAGVLGYLGGLVAGRARVRRHRAREAARVATPPGRCSPPRPGSPHP